MINIESMYIISGISALHVLVRGGRAEIDEDGGSDMTGQGPPGDIWHRRLRRRRMINNEKGAKGYTRSHAHLTNLKSIDFLQVAGDF